MKPVHFKQSNRQLEPPPDFTPDQTVLSIEPLSVWTDERQCVSCWRMSWKERIYALLFGKVWCAVLSGDTQPPIYLESHPNYFRVTNE